MTAPVPATTEVFLLAEGPVWDAARNRLLWVDIVAGSVLEGTLDDGQIQVARRHQFDGTVGAVTVADDGTLLVAGQENLVLLHPDDRREDGVRFVPPGQRRRLNDASTDPAGRFLVGTLSMADPSESEILVRLEPSGQLTELDNDLTLTSCIARRWRGIAYVGDHRGVRRAQRRGSAVPPGLGAPVQHARRCPGCARRHRVRLSGPSLFAC